MRSQKRWASEVRWAWGPLVAAAGLVAVAGAACAAAAMGLLPALAFPMAALPVSLSLFLVHPRPVEVARRPKRVHVAHGALSFGDETVRADEVTHAAVLPRRDHTELRLDRRGGPALRLAFRKTTTALRVLSALGVDPSRTVERRLLVWSSVDAPAARAALRGLGFVLTLLAGATSAPWQKAIFGVAAFAVIAFTFLTLPRMTLAEDGLEVRSPFRRRFVPFAAITGIELDEALRGGRVRVLVGTEAPIELDSDDAAGLAARLRARLALEGRRDPSPPTPPELARNDRPPSAWIAGLRAAADVPSFRTPSLALSELRRVALDPRATLEARAAAAVALSTRPDERAVLARVAEGTAVPALRVVMDAAATGDDGALVSALDALPAEDEGQLRRR